MFTAIAVPDSVDRYLDHVMLNSHSLTLQAVKHIKLCFIGQVTTSTAIQLTKALANVQSEPFEITVEGCELFKPESTRPILVAMVKPSSELETLHQSVGDIFQEYGVVLESRPFKPHITLMRFSEPYNEEISRAMLRAQIISTRFMADRFVLYSVDRALAIPYLKQQEYRF